MCEYLKVERESQRVGAKAQKRPPIAQDPSEISCSCISPRAWEICTSIPLDHGQSPLHPSVSLPLADFSGSCQSSELRYTANTQLEHCEWPLSLFVLSGRHADPAP